MPRLSRWTRLTELMRTELHHLTRINPSDRRWQMPLAAALAMGLPLLSGVYAGHLDYGLIASIGGLLFLYLPRTPLYHRMIWLMACGFGMMACFALGVISHIFPPLQIWMLTFITVLVTMVCRYYGQGAPGSLFFVMAGAIGAYLPREPLVEVPLKVGLMTLGCLSAALIAFFYSLYTLRLKAPEPVPSLPSPTFDTVVFDSVIIGAFVGLSLALAQALQMERPYWVPISCLAVLQGMTLRAVWNKQLQRVIGTGIGLVLSWGLLLLPLDGWNISLLIMVLVFVIETAVVRHYGFAVIFITPLTLFIAEAAEFGTQPPAVLIQARFFDTVLGCLVGLAGGICLYSPRFRRLVGGQLRRLIPERLKDS